MSGLLRKLSAYRLSAERSRAALAAGCVFLSWATAMSGQSAVAPEITVTHPPDASAPYIDGRIPREVLYPSHPPRATPPDRPLANFANSVARNVSAIRVRWFDQVVFKDDAHIVAVLRELLSDPKTDVYGFHIWSFGPTPASIVATVEHSTGKQGQLLVFCTRDIRWAYQDSRGEWWWASPSFDSAQKVCGTSNKPD
jgi:hypothetical protein